MSWVAHAVIGQQFRCRNCGMRTCCGIDPPCGTFGPWPHDYAPLGTGKPTLLHLRGDQ